MSVSLTFSVCSSDFWPRKKSTRLCSREAGTHTNHLYPVTIRIQDESNVPHASVRKLLLELVASIFKALASGLEIIYRNTQVTKALVWLRVAIGDLVIWVILGAIIVRQLDDALPISPVVSMRHCFWAVVRKEVEIKFGVWIRKLVDECHAQELVELEGPFGILDANPRQQSEYRSEI